MIYLNQHCLKIFYKRNSLDIPFLDTEIEMLDEMSAYQELTKILKVILVWVIITILHQVLFIEI